MEEGGKKMGGERAEKKEIRRYEIKKSYGMLIVMCSALEKCSDATEQK